MKQYIGCDTHLRYSVFRILSEDGVMGPAIRVELLNGHAVLIRHVADQPVPQRLGGSERARDRHPSASSFFR